MSVDASAALTSLNSLVASSAAAQGVGVIAAVVGLSSYLQKHERGFKWQVGISSWIWGVHFGMLGSQSGMLTQFAIGTRSWCSMFVRTTNHRHALFWISFVVFCAFAVVGWDGWISLLPLGAAVNSTAALVYADNRAMRIRLLGSSALWIATGIYWQSWSIIATEAIAVALNLRTIFSLRET